MVDIQESYRLRGQHRFKTLKVGRGHLGYASTQREVHSTTCLLSDHSVFAWIHPETGSSLPPEEACSIVLQLLLSQRKTGRTCVTFCNFSLALPADILKNIPHFSFNYLKSPIRCPKSFLTSQTSRPFHYPFCNRFWDLSRCHGAFKSQYVGPLPPPSHWTNTHRGLLLPIPSPWLQRQGSLSGSLGNASELVEKLSFHLLSSALSGLFGERAWALGASCHHNYSRHVV